MYKLRDYQKQSSNIAVQKLRSNEGKPFILVLATGAGKSLVIADICHQLDAPTLILQPSKEILEQNYNKLVSYGIEDVSMYSASMNSKEIAKYTYATIQSIYKKPIIVEPKQPATMFELRIGRWSFILSFVSHTKGAK